MMYPCVRCGTDCQGGKDCPAVIMENRRSKPVLSALTLAVCLDLAIKGRTISGLHHWSHEQLETVVSEIGAVLRATEMQP